MASRMGLRETPNSSASRSSTRRSPGLKWPDRIAARISSATFSRSGECRVTSRLWAGRGASVLPGESAQSGKMAGSRGKIAYTKDRMGPEWDRFQTRTMLPPEDNCNAKRENGRWKLIFVYNIPIQPPVMRKAPMPNPRTRRRAVVLGMLAAPHGAGDFRDGADLRRQSASGRGRDRAVLDHVGAGARAGSLARVAAARGVTPVLSGARSAIEAAARGKGGGHGD